MDPYLGIWHTQIFTMKTFQIFSNTRTQMKLYKFKSHHRVPLVRQSLYKYKYLWDVEGKDRSLSLQERTSHTYTLKLGQSRNSILYKKSLLICLGFMYMYTAFQLSEGRCKIRLPKCLIAQKMVALRFVQLKREKVREKKMRRG